MKALGPAVMGAVAGYGVKVLDTRREARRQKLKADQALWELQKQSHWSPLLDAARDLRTRLEELTVAYTRGPNSHFDPDSLSRDFRELYTLRSDHIEDREKVDANEPRMDQRLAQLVRTRMCHQLTFAVSTLYRTARYVAFAERVRADLQDYKLLLPPKWREEMLSSIANVRIGLQGPGGAGIFIEQQESIAEIMWDSAGRLITNFEFRKKLLELPGWEQFTGIFRFYMSRGDDTQDDRSEFRAKLKHEIKATILAAEELEAKGNRLLQVFEGNSRQSVALQSLKA
jgi:hypothetical protein